MDLQRFSDLNSYMETCIYVLAVFMSFVDTSYIQFKHLIHTFHSLSAYIDIPAPDYDGAPGTGYYHNNHHTPPQSHHQPGDQEYLSKQSIRKNMSQEIKEINKDISMRPKQ